MIGGRSINIECNVGGGRVSQWVATDVRIVRGQDRGKLGGGWTGVGKGGSGSLKGEGGGKRYH